MAKFVIHNKEIYTVNYLVEADSKEEAVEKWLTGDEYKELEDKTYVSDLAVYADTDILVTEIF